MARDWTRLIRFISEEDGQIHLGEVDAAQYPDIGLAIFEGARVTVKLIHGSIYDGHITDEVRHVARVSSLYGLPVY